MLARPKEHIHLLYDLRTILLHPICFNFPFVCLTNSLSLHVTGKFTSIKNLQMVYCPFGIIVCRIILTMSNDVM